MKSSRFYKVIAILLLLMAGALLEGHDASSGGGPAISGLPLVLAGLAAGFGIGIVASLLGVAGAMVLFPRSCCCMALT